MDKSNFIAELIEALKFNQESIHESKASPITIFRKLCYDFPIVSDDDIYILATSKDEVINDINVLNPTFFRNCIEICGHGSNSSSSIHSLVATTNLSIFLFVKLPEMLFYRTLSSLSAVLKVNVIVSCSEDVDESKQSESVKLLDWRETLIRIEQFCTTVTSTMILSAGIEELRRHNTVELLLTLMRIWKSQQTIRSHYPNPLTATLKEMVQHWNDSEVNVIGSTEFQDYEYERGCVDRIWIHYFFIIRDILQVYPQTISSYFPSLAQILLSNTYEIREINDPTLNVNKTYVAVARKSSLATTSFPTKQECLFALLCASVANTFNHNSISPKTRHSSPESSSSLSTLAQTRDIYHCLTPYLPVLADTLDRMLKYGSLVETCSLTCDVISILLDNVAVYQPTATAPYKDRTEALLSSRLLSVFLFLYVDTLRGYDTTNQSSRLSTYSVEARR